MACTLAPNGPCTLAPDGVGCIAPKTEGTFDPIITLLIQGHDDGFTVNWEIITSYPSQNVQILYRRQGTNDTMARAVGVRDTGSITIAGLPQGVIYDFYIRPEDTDNFGDWVIGAAITDAGWNSDLQSVIFGSEAVVFGADLVLF